MHLLSGVLPFRRQLKGRRFLLRWWKRTFQVKQDGVRRQCEPSGSAPRNRRTLLLLRSLGRLNLLPAFDGVCLSWSSSSSTPLRSLTSSKTTRSTEAKQLPALTAIGARALSHYLRLRSSRQRRRTRLRTNPGALTLFMTAFLRPAGRRPRSSVRPSVRRWMVPRSFFPFLASFWNYFRIGTALPPLHWIDKSRDK